jgi:hypothetical protein
MTAISINIPDPMTPQAAAALGLLSLFAQHPDLPAPEKWTIDDHSLIGWFRTGTDAGEALVPWALAAGLEKVCVGAEMSSIRWARGRTWVEMVTFHGPDPVPAEYGRVLTPAVYAEITAAARAAALAEVEHAITARVAVIDPDRLSGLLPPLAWTLRGARDGLVMAREVVEAMQGGRPVRQPDPCDPAEDDAPTEPVESDPCECRLPPWQRLTDDRYRLFVRGIRWALEYCDGEYLEVGEQPGWYLTGPEPYECGTWVGEVLAPAADTASRLIREHYAAEVAAERVPGPRLPLDDVETGGAA